MDAGTAPAKEPTRQHERLDVLDCSLLGLHSMADFEAVLEKYLPAQGETA
jgi:hypothetical protein